MTHDRIDGVQQCVPQQFMLPVWICSTFPLAACLHPAGDYHGSARTMSSDVQGKHKFELLRRLLSCRMAPFFARLPGRPTKDRLFTNPVHDSVR
ncbi:unnamed protein product [Urochloa humidicola]